MIFKIFLHQIILSQQIRKRPSFDKAREVYLKNFSDFIFSELKSMIQESDDSISALKVRVRFLFTVCL